jgi:DNA-binding NarL/FixJ family response regulator
MTMIRLLIVDDQKTVQEQISTLLNSQKHIKIVDTALNGQIAIEKVARLNPDLVLMDLEMPTMNGIEAAQLISKKYSSTKILFLTASNHQVLAKILRVGGRGYLLKSCSREDLVAAVSAVYRGDYYLGSEVIKRNLFFQSRLPNKNFYQENWTFYLAKEVVNFWRTNYFATLPNLERVMDNLAIKPVNINNLLNLKYRENSIREVRELIKIKASELQDLQKLTSEIENWFNSSALLNPFAIISEIYTQSSEEALAISFFELNKRNFN